MIKNIIVILFLLAGCARAPLTRIEDAMRKTESPPELIDSLSRENFFAALKKHLEQMKNSSRVADPMIFGQRKIEKKNYIESLERILQSEGDWLNYIKNNFDFYEVYGGNDWGEIMSTGYYEPRVRGSKTPTKEFTQPLYREPEDLVVIDMKSFADKFPADVKLSTLYGRIDNKKVTKYFDRKEIDTDKKLKNKKLELAWLDPLDSFFIQIQGSGYIDFPNGESMRVGYASQNGHPYVPIGKFLTESIPLEKMSMQRIKAHLENLEPSERDLILNKNPSYVFFKEIDSDALTYAGMEVSDGRTVATDKEFFPKGALAFLDIEIPVFNTEKEMEPATQVRAPRLVFDQDTGGAIRGGGRVDLFVGKGPLAAQIAGVMKNKGKLYYLVPKT